MGERGPVPKRSTQRRRHAEPSGPPPTSGRGSGASEWAEYAATLGITVPAGAKRSDIIGMIAGGGAAEDWHPLARQWFDSLGQSGQATFYEPSDWATARLLAESISRELSPQPMLVASGKEAHIEYVTLPPKGASLAAWLKAMSSLLATEGDRRRMRVELQAGDDGREARADVSDLDVWRRRLEARGSG
jgi:hypothetical protein